ncbi:MAG: alpha/beta hydrolase [Devosia sp.]|uniref:alpha/beta hydrolase n=1 Tax=Devosia sp. TaxID=1871048 RepID=UPI001A4FF075|nr:alpha/beta hydrolase [Devosia sp.]MBL8599571.1 alpha/beta hydrolase [Devosia sp.]
MALSPETAALMAEFAKSEGVPLEQMSVAEARKLSRDLTSLGLPAVPVARSEDVTLPVDGTSIMLRVLTPLGEPRGVLLFVHGGGWVIGSVDEWTALGTRLAAATQCIVVLPEYRLAPEHRFPVPVDDCWAALQWAARTYDLPLLVGGDSAGGNLAAVLALRARDQGAPRLAGQCLIYPVTDYEPARPSFVAADNQQILTAAGMLWFWQHYVEAPDGRYHADASPLRAGSLAGLPPTYLLTAEHDVLRDEGQAFGAALSGQGNNLVHEDFAGETHGFLTLGNALPAAGRAIDRIGAWSRQVLGAPR